jgi:hypothetical protein
MHKKDIHPARLAALMIILGLAGYIIYLSLPQNPASMSVKLGNESDAEQWPSSNAEEDERSINLENSRQHWLSLKNQGQTFWGSEKWMKEPEYYKNLDTISLATECFQKSIYQSEMIVFNDSIHAFARLEVFHNGFAELFGREDMWKGVLHVYAQASEKISPVYDIQTVAGSSLLLEALGNFYTYPPFQKQLKGHEREFLNANITAVKRYLTYLETYEPEKIGLKPDELPFSGPAIIVERVLVFTRQVYPQHYTRIEAAIHDVRWTQQPKVEDLKQYLKLVMTCFDNISNN